MKIAIIDYGMGNLRSVQKAVEHLGWDAGITHDQQAISQAEKVILPGVGAMAPAMARLNELDLVPTIQTVIQEDRPFLGICLGLQLLFDQSDEGGSVRGLGVVPGTVKRFQQNKVPHMGWNNIQPNRDCPLWSNIPDEAFVYFCHSYFVAPMNAEHTAATTQYGVPFASAVWRKRLFGVQFHPEKSQSVGLQILRNFLELKS